MIPRLREPSGADDEPAQRWTVRDCPEHPCCALEFPSGILCLACGSAIRDTLAGPAPLPATPELVEEAKAAWRSNRGVRDFVASALAKNPQTRSDDGTQD